MSRFLTQLGIRENPFSALSAEDEPDIDQYFIRPPYYRYINERGLKCQTCILFGERGAGKSATRLTLKNEAWRRIKRNDDLPVIPVTLDNYQAILDRGLNKVTVGGFVREVCFLVVEAVLVWLTSLAEDERETYVAGLDSSELELAIQLVDRFYLSRPEMARSLSSKKTLQLLSQAWPQRTALWVAKRWDALATIVSRTALAITQRKTELKLDVEKEVKQLLLPGTEARWDEERYARSALEKAVEFSRLFGFGGVAVLLDKADETTETGGSKDSPLKTAQLLHPLLATTSLLEIDGLGWIFFLWDKVKEPYSDSGGFTIRLDKIANATIKWEPAHLEDLVTKRLGHFSDNRVSQIAQLVSKDVDAYDFTSTIVDLSMRSPRELVRILDICIREHDEMYDHEESMPPLTPESIGRGLDRYVSERVKVIYKPDDIRQLIRLGMTAFVNKDVQGKFKINESSARNRIKRWEGVGIVTHTGQRRAEGGLQGGGKPAFEYSITDHRVVRILERGISLGEGFDNFDEEDSSLGEENVFGEEEDFSPGGPKSE